MVTDVCLEEAFSSCLSKRFPSYSMCKSTNKIIISDKDLSKFTNNSTEFINELSKTFSTSEEKATFKILEHFQKHDVFVKPPQNNKLWHKHTPFYSNFRSGKLLLLY